MTIRYRQSTNGVFLTLGERQNLLEIIIINSIRDPNLGFSPNVLTNRSQFYPRSNTKVSSISVLFRLFLSKFHLRSLPGIFKMLQQCSILITSKIYHWFMSVITQILQRCIPDPSSDPLSISQIVSSFFLLCFVNLFHLHPNHFAALS